MKIRITVEAISGEGEVLEQQQGEIDAKESAIAIRQWCMETFTSVKMNAIFGKDGGGKTDE